MLLESVYLFYKCRWSGNEIIYFYFNYFLLECVVEYIGLVNELKEMCEIRIEVVGILRDCRVSLIGVKVCSGV